MKKLLLLLVLALGLLTVQAQRITGTVVDHLTGEPLERATIQLFKTTATKSETDTTLVAGTYANQSGIFAFTSLGEGSYFLRISFLGYQAELKKVTLERNKNADLGRIGMKADAVELDEAKVTANVPKMIIKDDTVVYNADAYRVPEGSVIEALVEALPGAKIDDNGGVTINGKSVKKYKMDGRDFNMGSNETVLKNLPSYLIEQVKAYDDKSDLSRLTGIDDGNDDFTLEFVTRRNMRNGLQMNPDLGYGTHDRYGVRLTAMKPLGAMRYTILGNANNVNGRNFTGRGGRGRGNNNGQQHTKQGSLNVSYEDRKQTVKVSGTVNWNHSNTDNWNRTASESFVNTRGGAFSNSVNQRYGRSNSWSGNMNLQWKIDSVTTLSFRPNLSFSTSDSQGLTTSASFNANPFDYVPDALTTDAWQTMDDLGLIVNSRQNKSLSYSENKNVSSQLQLHRRLNSKGRNIALNTNVNYRDGNSHNANLSGVHLYQMTDRLGNDSTYQTNRYTASPSDNFGYSLGLTYTEPLVIFTPKASPDADSDSPRGPFGRNNNDRRRVGTQGLFLQGSYRYNYSHQKNDPATYDFPDYTDDAFRQVLNDYRDWTRLFGFLDNPYEEYLSERLSRFSERTEQGHNADIQLRIVREKYNMNVGLSANPQHSHFVQNYLGRPVDTTRTVTNVSPTLNMRYYFDRQTNLQVNYRGSSSQPSITQLLDIYDDTNPLSISMGNPGLKPSFTSNLNANFQTQRKQTLVEDSLGFQVPKAQRHWSFTSNATFSTTRNSIGNVVTYNEATGGRISRPENINGNWSTNAGISLDVGLDTLNRWDVSGSISGSYRHNIAYVNLNRTAIPDRNVTHTYNVNPSLSLSFRNSWLNFSINGNTTYARTDNRLLASNNRTTWNFSYGANMGIKAPWGTSIDTDIHMHSRRGYADRTLNTNELLWNAQLSHKFLRGKPLTVMLQFYDILNKQTNFTRTINANGWNDNEVNTITSYAMLHVSYRLNLFKGGNQRGRGGRPDFDGDDPRGERPEGFEGRGGRGGRGGFGGRPGGFGGGRPM